MRKLYKVTATFEYVVVADDASIDFVEQEHVRDALGDMSERDVDYSHEPYTPGCIDGWSGDCAPYNGASMTIDEWVENLK